ncbi:alpha/beta fold hydrolase [Subtercola lobariae]|uniref:Acyl-CoA synthetase n=1 Tax=Subtercola lobariae TaxID=1588641 RepID=A0A917B8I5_9MICO|nr:alpha/beta fold hydrolase [Subtercola lobariae]GGF25293.1 acyl-CoA synthetase [Subtercola lobariae]
MPEAQASLPPAGLPGLNDRWSRLVTAPDGEGVPRTWHLLDNASELAAAGRTPTGTILCVHGNPTWSYLWRSVLSAAVDAARHGSSQVWRVIAVDQLEMGFSERTDQTRTLPRRIADLSALTAELQLEAPVVTLGHDWGGAVSLGWAVDHPEVLAGVMLLNTAVHQPEEFPLPAALRLVLQRSLLANSTVRTTAFLDTTLAIAHPTLAPDVRRAFRAPYRSAARRAGIGAFVADIPVDALHPSFAELTRVSTGVAQLSVPALMLWGPRDPVFSDRYLGDLMARLPHAAVTRFENAGHLVGEDVAVAPIMLEWLSDTFGAGVADGLGDGVRAAATESVATGGADFGGTQSEVATAATGGAATVPAYRALWETLDERAHDDSAAVVEMAPRGSAGGIRTVSWRLLARRVSELAAGLEAVGVKKGDRVSLLVPPGADLTAVLYACLRIGAVVVVADAGLGVKGLSRAVRGARPQHIIGIEKGLAAARALGWPGQKISAPTLSRTLAAALGVSHSLADVMRLGQAVLSAQRSVSSRPAAAEHPEPASDDAGLAAAAGPARLVDDDAGLAAAAVAEHPEPSPDDTAAVLFTSGSTGPAKGVVYTHRQLSALVGLLRERFDISVGTGLVAGFAPFALLGPALGATSVTPDMDVTSPKTLTATAVVAAAHAVKATVVFASPAALANVLATSGALTLPQRRVLGRVQTVLSAGAPLPVPLLERVQTLMPEASIHTPYGMTEGLLMTDITLGEIVEAEREHDAEGEQPPLKRSERVSVSVHAVRDENAPDARDVPLGGVCVGRPVAGVQIRISALDELGHANGPLEESVGVTGEIVVSAPHLKDHYDQLWLTDREATRGTPSAADAPAPAPARWHRTGDVGHFDARGRLWVEGRLVHVVTTATGVVTPVAPEQRIERLAAVRRAAIVGVGPVATQQPVAIIETRERTRAAGLAPTALVTAVRAASKLDVVAVFVVPELPTDVRHNSKIDRAALASWASDMLAGRRAGRL